MARLNISIGCEYFALSYRVSDQTNSAMKKVVDGLQERIWVPSRAAEEFLTSKNTVINGEIKKYSDVIKQLDILKLAISNVKTAPFVDDELSDDCNGFFDRLRGALEDRKKLQQSRLKKTK